MNEQLADLSNLDRVGHEVDRIEGNLLYIKGFKYPMKGVPTIERVNEANRLKRELMCLNFKRCFPRIIVRGDTGFPTQFMRLLSACGAPMTVSSSIRFVLQFDQAYRFRLQDLFSESTPEKLSKSPLREVFRLYRLHYKRDRNNHVGVYWQYRLKMGACFAGVLALLTLPHVRKRFRDALKKCNYQILCFDENDLYWAAMKYDYDYQGIRFSDR